MTTPTPAEIAELDQDYAAVAEMVDGLITFLRTSLRVGAGELDLVGQVANGFVASGVDNDRICMVAAIALVRAAALNAGETAKQGDPF